MIQSIYPSTFVRVSLETQEESLLGYQLNVPAIRSNSATLFPSEADLSPKPQVFEDYKQLSF